MPSMRSSRRSPSLEASVRKAVGKKWYAVSSTDKKTVREISYFQKNSKNLRKHDSLMGQYEELGLA